MDSAMTNDIEGQDQDRRCCDCDRVYVFTRGEQAFFLARQLTPPRRCQSCRQAHKAARVAREAREWQWP